MDRLLVNDLLFELYAADQIIKHALNLMSPAQKTAWAFRNSTAGVIGEGDTRSNERLAVLARLREEAKHG